MKEEIIAIKNGRGWFVKKTHFVVSLIILLFILMGSVISPFVWKATVDLKIKQISGEVIRLDKKMEKSIINNNQKIDYIYKYLLNKNGK